METKELLYAYRPNLKEIGICPICGEPAYNEQDVVWTCPRDLAPNNRYWEPSEVTEAQQEEAGIYSYCYEDFGGWCGDHMPMHGWCYCVKGE
jgi:hypothetical protein